MSYEIQPGIDCENCIRCGTRPVVEQVKRGWAILCPNTDCKNIVEGPLLDFAGWNRLNQKNVNLKADASLKRTA